MAVTLVNISVRTFNQSRFFSEQKKQKKKELNIKTIIWCQGCSLSGVPLWPVKQNLLVEKVVWQSLYSQSQSLQHKGHSVGLCSEVGSGRSKTVYGQTVDLQERQTMLNGVPAPSIVHQCL